MIFEYNNKKYEIVIEKKNNKNTYIRVKEDLKVYVSTSYLTPKIMIKSLIENNRDSIIKMIQKREKDNIKQSENYFLGEKIEIRMCDTKKTFFDGQTLYSNSKENIEKWYKKKCEIIFKEHLDNIYNRYSEKIPYPDLRIRKMTTRWGVCNIKSKTVTLNLELIKRDLKYLDYVIVHELSHLIEANHSKAFWALVEENCKDYKKYRKEMKDF